jgi:hypothetical protein
MPNAVGATKACRHCHRDTDIGVVAIPVVSATRGVKEEEEEKNERARIARSGVQRPIHASPAANQPWQPGSSVRR